MSALVWRGVSFAYPRGDAVLRGIDLAVGEGDVVLVVGPSGCGKSTFLRTTNGLVPHSSGGRFSGDVVVFGRTIREHRPRDLADVVGFVHQDPEAQFVVDRVEADIAFVLENLDVDPPHMRRRVEEVLDALDVAHLRDRSPSTLSGGERQRCAIASAMAAGPAGLVLDEPTSQLDPQGAEDVFGALARLNADLGTTVIIAEHRLERAGPLADRAVLLDRGRVTADGPPGAVLADYDGAASVTRLGRLLGWDPAPLTVREARAMRAASDVAVLEREPAVAIPSEGAVLVSAQGVSVKLGNTVALRDVDIEVRRGEVVGLLGRNGAGKTTLMRTIAGILSPDRGRVVATGTTAYVPQDPNTLLFAPTVRAELAETLRLLGRRDQGAVDRWLDAVGLSELGDRHPRTLSGGERQRVAVAAVAIGGADVLLLDEPTRGMDAASRTALENAARAHADTGGAVVLATHDVELAARCATRVVVLGDGDVVADGPARHVLSGSLFAPQVLRVMPPFLTVEEVSEGLARSAT
ncbi:MAG: ATP-binding cassette domain-containing protein [Acidimicrobiia bacterium]|nr:ATP-binding cassette domain-containing protein [Acidimicrobiia bacterium]